jgi:hypothetical protein
MEVHISVACVVAEGKQIDQCGGYQAGIIDFEKPV